MKNCSFFFPFIEKGIDTGRQNEEMVASVKFLLICSLWNYVEERKHLLEMSPFSIACLYRRADLLPVLTDLYDFEWKKVLFCLLEPR